MLSVTPDEMDKAQLRVVMPLPQLSTQESTALVMKHLTNRTQSRKSRLRKQRESSCET